MGPEEGEPFVEASFTVRERLHLLTHVMDAEPRAPEFPVTRATRATGPRVLALDDLAFAPFWRLGALGLRDALDATPVRQFRATRTPSRRSRDTRSPDGPGTRATSSGSRSTPSTTPRMGHRWSPTRCSGSGVTASTARS